MRLDDESSGPRAYGALYGQPRSRRTFTRKRYGRSTYRPREAGAEAVAPVGAGVERMAHGVPMGTVLDLELDQFASAGIRAARWATLPEKSTRLPSCTCLLERRKVALVFT